MKRQAPEETTTETASINIGWWYGLRLFNEGFYWEAHEVLEQVWMNAVPNSRERFLVQAVIHIANGALKTVMGRANAAKRLAGLAAECTQRAFAGETESILGLTELEMRNVLASVEGTCGVAHFPLHEI